MAPASGWLDRLPTDRLLAEISLWSADLLRLGDDIARFEPFTDLFHIDVADGHFSPALLLFPDQIAAIRQVTAKPLHVHLMVDDAILLAQVEQFAKAGADVISVHAENANAATAIGHIAGLGCIPGVVLQLETPVDACRPLLDRIGILTLLGTETGIKGAGLDSRAGPRLEEARQMLQETGHRVLLAADGGIREHTVPLLRKAGAETIVMGSLAFGAPNLPARMAWVHAQ
jgi:ribulose-phosphate 3-epimerase